MIKQKCLAIIGISECRIKAGRLPLSNINMSNYSYEYTPTDRVLRKPYLMALHVIFPIHLNFPIRARYVLKAIIHWKKRWIVLQLLEKVFLLLKRHFSWYCMCMSYLINFSILSWSVPVFHVSLSIIYVLFLPYDALYKRFFLNICKGFSL